MTNPFEVIESLSQGIDPDMFVGDATCRELVCELFSRITHSNGMEFVSNAELAVFLGAILAEATKRKLIAQVPTH